RQQAAMTYPPPIRPETSPVFQYGLTSLSVPPVLAVARPTSQPHTLCTPVLPRVSDGHGFSTATPQLSSALPIPNIALPTRRQIAMAVFYSWDAVRNLGHRSFLKVAMEEVRDLCFDIG